MNQLRELLEAFALQLHGNNLLAPAARRWLNFMKLAIIVVVAMEGAAWSYGAGWLLGDGELSKWFWRAVVGFTVTTLLWGLDAQFITIDVNEHQKNTKQSSTQRREQDNDAQSTREKIWQFLKWPGLPVGGRVLIILGSLYVTAPLIALYELRNEIDHDMETHLLNAVKDKQQALEKAINKPSQDAEPEQIRVAREDVGKSNNELISAREILRKAKEKFDSDKNREREIAITSANRDDSTIPPISQTALRQAYINVEAAKRKHEEKDKIYASLLETHSGDDKQAREYLSKFITLVESKNYKGLRDTFGITQDPNSLTTRFDALIAWNDKPAFQRVTRITYVLLGVMAAVIFLGKYYQPNSVRIYLSEQWQAHWSSYLRGDLDDRLPQKYTVNREQVSPIAFCALWLKYVEPVEKNEEIQSIIREIDALDHEYGNDLSRLDNLKGMIEEANKAIGEKEIAHKHATEAISSLRSAMETLRKNKDAMKDNMMQVIKMSDARMTEHTLKEITDIESQIQTTTALSEEAVKKSRAIEIELGALRSNLPSTWKQKEELAKSLDELYFKKIRTLKEGKTKLAATASSWTAKPPDASSV